jgi:2-phosphosulfolactate phosphatase
MKRSLEILFAPAEFAALARRDLSRTVCVVFDVFRATSTIVTALANGAEAMIPVAEIADAVTIRRARPDVLLAGERDGVRITAAMTGGIDFDLGNSPREFTASRIKHKTIAISTTNGSRALRACAHASMVLAGSFLNLAATAKYLQQFRDAPFLFVCSGTGDQTAYEDVLGAGALVELIGDQFAPQEICDSANIAGQIYQQNAANLLAAADYCRNGRRLLAMPALRDDVAFCLARDTHPIVAKLEKEAVKLAI